MTSSSIARRSLLRTLSMVVLTIVVTVGGIAHVDARERDRGRERAVAAECVPGEDPASPTQANEEPRPPCEPEGPPGHDNCSDTIDNDDDGTVDGDGDGVVEVVEGVPEDEDCEPDDTDICSDGRDNEEGDPPGGDGLTDLEDPDCFGVEGPPLDPTCSDGIDNDGDGLIDRQDPDCFVGGGGGGPGPQPEEPQEPEPEPEQPEEDPCANPTIVGTAGNDKIKGTKGPDVIDGLGGNDRIRAKRGNDILCGGDGTDKLRGGKGNDVLYASDGDDKERGGPGVDQLDGGPGFDRCRTGRGDDPAPISCEKIRPPPSLK